MIVGIGLDMIEVERVKKALEQHSRFSSRVFTSGEIEYCQGKKNPCQHFAARFAAKEAFFKAIGRRIPWTSVEVTNLTSGKPRLLIHHSENLEFSRANVSLSHLANYALAVVILEK